MTELHQKLMLLRPMRTGVSGFARLQWERGQAWAQLKKYNYELIPKH